MLKRVSFHIQAHLNAFLQVLEYFPQICLGPLARESPCTNLITHNWMASLKFISSHAKYNLIVIIASCLDVCRVLTVHSILYKQTRNELICAVA